MRPGQQMIPRMADWLAEADDRQQGGAVEERIQRSSGPSMKRIKCSLCVKDVYLEGETALRDHLAARHIGYLRHKCDTCGMKCVEATTMWAHLQEEAGHRVMFNKVSLRGELGSDI